MISVVPNWIVDFYFANRYVSVQTVTYNVIDYGAKADDVTDDTAAINAAAAAAGAVKGTVLIPSGKYYVKGQINIPANSVVRGEGFASSILHVKSDANPSLATMFCQGDNVTIKDLQIQFDQPDTTNLAQLTRYKPAIIPGPRSRLSDLMVGAAWNGFDLAYYGASQTQIENVSMGAFNVGINIDSVSDTVRIKALQFSAFGMTANNSQIFYSLNGNRSVTDGVSNGTTTYTSATASFTSSDVGKHVGGTDIPGNTSIVSVINSTTVTLSKAATGTHTGNPFSVYGVTGIDVTRSDGLFVTDCLFINAGNSIKTTSDGIDGPYVYCNGVECDGPGNIAHNGGTIVFQNGSIYSGGIPKVIQTGGHLQLIGNTYFIHGPGDSPYGQIKITGGVAQVIGGIVEYVNNAERDQTFIVLEGGTLMLNGCYIERGPTGSHTFIRPTISVTGGVLTATGNRITSLTGTGVFISLTRATAAADAIGLNSSPGWSNVIPATVFALDGTGNGASLTMNGGTVAQPFGNANNFSGLVIISDTNWTLSTALFLIGFLGVTKIADSNDAFTTTPGTAGKANLYLNANRALEIQNNYIVTPNITYKVWAIRMKTSV